MVVFNRVPWSCDPQRAQLKLVRSPKGARVSWNGDSPKSSTFLNDFPWNKQSSYSAIEVSPFSIVSWTCPRSSPLCFGGALWQERRRGHWAWGISAAWFAIASATSLFLFFAASAVLPGKAFSFAQMAKWHKKLALAYQNHSPKWPNGTRNSPWLTMKIKPKVHHPSSPIDQLSKFSFGYAPSLFSTASKV